MATSDAETTTITLKIRTEQTGEDEYEITQINAEPALLQQDMETNSQKHFKVPIAFGIAIEGYFDTSAKEFSIWASLAGVQIGNKYTVGANGVTLKLNLLVASGSIHIYKESNQLKADWSLKPPFWSKQTGTVVLFTI